MGVRVLYLIFEHALNRNHILFWLKKYRKLISILFNIWISHNWINGIYLHNTHATLKNKFTHVLFFKVFKIRFLSISATGIDLVFGIIIDTRRNISREIPPRQKEVASRHISHDSIPRCKYQKMRTYKEDASWNYLLVFFSHSQCVNQKTNETQK